MRLSVLLLLTTVALAAQSPGVDEALSRPILATEQTRIDTQVWTRVAGARAARAGITRRVGDLRRHARCGSASSTRSSTAARRREWRTQKVVVESFGEIAARRLSRPQDPLRGGARAARTRSRVRAGAGAVAPDARRPELQRARGHGDRQRLHPGAVHQPREEGAVRDQRRVDRADAAGDRRPAALQDEPARSRGHPGTGRVLRVAAAHASTSRSHCPTPTRRASP